MNKLYLILFYFIIPNFSFPTDFKSSELNVRNDEVCSTLMNSILSDNKEKIKEILSKNKMFANCELSSTAPGLGHEITKRPLTFAARLGRAEVMKSLIEAGAEIDFIDNGKTALLFAIDNFKPEIVEILIKNKANKKIKYDDFDSAFDYAKNWLDLARNFPGLLDNKKILKIVKLLK